MEQTNDPARLVAAARGALEHAYAPYSKRAIGAAVLGADGVIYTGGNIENALRGLALCAEQVALAHAVARGNRTLRAIAIVNRNGSPCYPCGVCRQMLAEFSAAGRGMEVIVEDAGRPLATTLSALLPDPYRPG
jgi:cytidine deaminase